MNSKKYENKYFSVLGDSISTLEGYSEPKGAEYYDLPHKRLADVFAVSDTWWGRVIESLGGKLLCNNSVSGSTVCWDEAYEKAYYGCSDERTSALSLGGINPDVIMVFLGINDWGWALPISRKRTGQVLDETKPKTFLDAYGKMLEKLKGNYPNAEIWCLTLPISRCSAMQDFQFPYCYRGRHIGEYSKAIRACATEYGCRVIDLDEKAPHDTLDGFHPNFDGMKALADAVLAELEKE